MTVPPLHRLPSTGSKERRPLAFLLVVVAAFNVPLPSSTIYGVSAFTSTTRSHNKLSRRIAMYPSGTVLRSKDDDDVKKSSVSAYEDESSASAKGVVGSLTALFNALMPTPQRVEPSGPPPATPADLLQTVAADYTSRNYLWTGDVEIAAFAEDCRFTDPTLSFVGRDAFVTNVQQIRPVLDLLAPDLERSCESRLLDIALEEKEGYVATRWNMVGTLGNLPWKPKIDVIGQTKFWYRPAEAEMENDRDWQENGNSGGGVQVYFYDEKWEMEPGKALLQLITPGPK
uniref:Uncharacterized protein n=1 Tax=Corethron hystrix TaxID=216773 RepID=A0A7S1B9P6_9STRA|mmetsp:Transcript_18482/g.42296  ORF Transcript_18482/g.42296 Transcript_18482/m.42296 type:complete len:286 (+) Transcript_18482:79-936(+)